MGFPMHLVLATAATLIGTCALAQDAARNYPERPIRVIVTFTPGGPTDIVARSVAQKLSEAWGQPVVVDNRPGAGGNIGMDIVAKAPADGYTLVLGSFGPMIISPFVYAKLPYDPVKDFTAVTLAATSWFFLVVNPSTPAGTLKELVALAKSKPGMTFSSSGNASPSHLAGELLKNLGDIDLTHVPYKGGAPAVTAVLSGEVQMAIESPPPIVPLVKANKLRALAAARPSRSPLLPDVPTVSEAGMPGLEVGSWYGFLTPAGTPKAIIDKLNHEMVKWMNTQELKDRFSGVGADPVAGTPAEFDTFIRAELKKWGSVVRKAGVKVD
jgi:tripartite-type tricarboxylate transporter receptor subunit TctC